MGVYVYSVSPARGGIPSKDRTQSSLLGGRRLTGRLASHRSPTLPCSAVHSPLRSPLCIMISVPCHPFYCTFKYPEYWSSIWLLKVSATCRTLPVWTSVLSSRQNVTKLWMLTSCIQINIPDHLPNRLQSQIHYWQIAIHDIAELNLIRFVIILLFWLYCIYSSRTWVCIGSLLMQCHIYIPKLMALNSS